MAGNRQMPRSFQSPSARDSRSAAVSGRRIEHEESHQPRRVPGDGRRDRLLVARDAGDDRGARDLMAIELGDPAIGQRIGRSRRIPSEQGRDHGGVIARGDVTTILGEDFQESRGEEVAMNVADLHRSNFRSGRARAVRGAQPNGLGRAHLGRLAMTFQESPLGSSSATGFLRPVLPAAG